MISTFRERIADSAAEKNSPVVVAIDPGYGQNDLAQFGAELVRAVEKSVCAIKMNFHMLLPLSAKEVSDLNRLAHSFGLQSIADIKLNDIGQTNLVTLDHLSEMGFDAVIANPFVGATELVALSKSAHKLSMGVIALVFMSHQGAPEGYGLVAVARGRKRPLYRLFLERAAVADADGIVIGANQTEILSEVSRRKDRPPIYSPGIGVQGGNIQKAISAGTDYLIIGRAIIDAKDPRLAARSIREQVDKIKKHS